MAVFQSLVSFDEMFATLKYPPVIINDSKFTREEEREEVYKNFMTIYSKDKISTAPSCDCGKTVGAYQLGTKCGYCGTSVTTKNASSIEPHVWFRRPANVSKLINPIVWKMIEEKTMAGRVSLLNWICDTSYEARELKHARIQPNISAFMATYVNDGMPKTYNGFVENFINVLEYIRDSKYLKQIKNDKNGEFGMLIDMIKLPENQNKIFSDYIPFPNKVMVVFEKSGQKPTFEITNNKLMEIVNGLAGIDVAYIDTPRANRKRQERTARSLNKLAAYYEEFIYVFFIGKEGLIRHHLYSSRAHFSIRCVITSITEPHEHDEIHIPWGAAIGVFKLHLANKLMRRKGKDFTYNDALGYILGRVDKYDPLLDELFQELISESRDKSIYVMINRNPSLTMSSVQRKRITKVKTEVRDSSISIPIMSTTAYNADFDGDEMNVLLSVDNKMADLWENLSPHRNLFWLESKPFEVSDNYSFSKPVVSTIGEWLRG